MSRLLAPVATVLAIAWMAIIVIAPQLPASLAAFIYAFASLICHQRPERSFHLAGAQLPVCARCFGIYTGAALGLFVASGRRAYEARRARQGSAGRGLFVGPAIAMFMAALPTTITLAVEWANLWDPGNAIRAAAGTILGAGVAAVVVTLHYDECTPRRPIASSPRRPLI